MHGHLWNAFPARCSWSAPNLLVNKHPFDSNIFVCILLQKTTFLASIFASEGLRFSLPECPCLQFSSQKENLVFKYTRSWQWQAKCILFYTGSLRYLSLTHYIFFCCWRFQHSSSYSHTACESELPPGSLLPTDWLKDLNSHEKNPDDEVILYVTVIQPPTGWLPGCLALTGRSICRQLSQKTYYLWQITELFDSFVQS